MLDDQATPTIRKALVIRITIGLAQGLALYALHRWRAEFIPAVLGALVLTLWLVPIAALGAVGAARSRTTASWLAAAALITLVIGAYAFYVDAPPAQEAGAWVSPAVAFFTATAIFILHHLILPADAERRWRATFERYFDEGWKDAVRLALGVVFVGALWLLLWLGASLFKLIGLDFLEKLIAKPWFSFPATTTFFAIAVHITDIRVGLVRGARTLVLSLLSWLLPVLALIAAGFLIALPFTGLAPLWATRSSSGVMLAACAALVILINATYQDGERDGFPPLVLKWTVRIAAVTLAPLTLVAAYGVRLRIGQHGFTPGRIYALACLAIAVCYAAGYAWAAFSRGPWMKRLETTNWITAQVAVAVLLAIFSPLLDPARIAAASQVQRLESGRISLKAFDFDFLRFGAGRWGQTALKHLAANRTGPHADEIAQLAQAQLRRTNRWEVVAPTQAQRLDTIHPVGGPLPPTFLSQGWPAGTDPATVCIGPIPVSGPGQICQAMTAELDDAPGPEIIVFGSDEAQVYSQRNGRWTDVGRLYGLLCGDYAAAAKAGRVRIVPPNARADVEINGRRLVLLPDSKCPGVDGAAGADTR
ncbi:MAG: hypothetical protein JWP50_1195 [Phenylobacterium sp.]|nr:hypothetical protein [Phenylobacterium sp.]